MSRRATRPVWPLLAALLVPTLVALRSASASRATAERTTWDSVYTAEQAARGQAAYAKECARCHASGMEGADAAPALVGSAFVSAWNDQLLDALHERIHTAMPTDTPGVYSRQLVTDVVAHMLKANGFPAGAQELSHADGALHGIRFVAARPSVERATVERPSGAPQRASLGARATQGARVPSTR